MKSAIKKFMVLLLDFLPGFLGDLPYHFLALTVRHFLKNSRYRIIFRNSYALKQLVPGLSDLDIGFIYQFPPTKEEIKILMIKYKFLKRFFPILGELNIYVEVELDQLSRVFNLFEMKRIPELCESKWTWSNGRKEEAAVFLLRMLDSDRKHLTGWIKFRKAKWNYQMRIVDLPEISEDLNVDLIVHRIDSLLSEISFEQLREIITREHLEAYEDEALRSWLLVFYPHIWLKIANGRDRITLDLEMLDLNDQQLSLVLASLRWEIMGIYTQFRILPTDSNRDYYLKMLEKMLSILAQRYRRNDIDDCKSELKCLMSILQM